MDVPTKRSVFDDTVIRLPRYQQELLRDLGYGRIRPPNAWLCPGDAVLIALDGDVPLDAAQLRELERLLGRFVRFVSVIDALIRGYVASRRHHGTLAKNDADSLVRGRGPARVRDVLFEVASCWPDDAAAGPEVVARVEATLDRALADRRADRSAEEAASRMRVSDLSAVVAPLLADVRASVDEWATRRRLDGAWADWVLSEVIDQLIRTAALTGPPDDIRRWALVTAKRKWQGSQPSGPGRRAAHDPLDDDTADRIVARLDLEHVLLRGYEDLVQRSRAFRLHGRTDDAIAGEVAAILVGSLDPDRLADVVQGTPEGLRDLADLLELRGRRLTSARRTAVTRFVRDTLRSLLSRG